GRLAVPDQMDRSHAVERISGDLRTTQPPAPYRVHAERRTSNHESTAVDEHHREGHVVVAGEERADRRPLARFTDVLGVLVPTSAALRSAAEELGRSLLEEGAATLLGVVRAEQRHLPGAFGV